MKKKKKTDTLQGMLDLLILRALWIIPGSLYPALHNL
jgi:hypothetical protein